MSDITAGTLLEALYLLRTHAGPEGICAHELAAALGIDTAYAASCLKELLRRKLAEPVPHAGMEIRMRYVQPWTPGKAHGEGGE